MDDSHTRVTISGVGYREGEGYDALLGFFREGSAWTFGRLKKRFDEGPLEWDTVPPGEPPHSAITSNNNRS